MKTKFFILFISMFLHYCQQLYAAPRSGCTDPNSHCNPPKYARISSTKLTSGKKLQVFDVSSLNLKTPNFKTEQATQSAISITESDFNLIAAAGNSWLYYFSVNGGISMNVGTANNSTPQSWILPANLMTVFQGVSRSDFLLPSSIPTNLQISGANRVMKNYLTDEDDNLLLEYEHFDLNANTIELLGTSYDLANGIDPMFDEPNFEFSDIPLDLDDSWTITEDNEDYQTGLNLTRIVQNIVVDAFGTITTPDGVFNCLRLNSVQQFYSRANETSSFTLNSTKNVISFVTKNGYYFQGDVSSTSGTATVTNLAYRKIVATNSLTEIADVKLNNDSKGVSINSDNETPHPSAILDVKSTALGVLIPRIVIANRPTNPAQGLLIYQVDNNAGFYYFDGTNWLRLSTDGGPVQAQSRKLISDKNPPSGLAQLKSGVTFIKFDSPVENYKNLQINIQLENDCNGVFISKKTREGFEVKELQKGKSDAKFSWKIINE